MITRWEFELYLGLTACLIIALMWVSHKYGSRTILIDVGLVALFGKSQSLLMRLFDRVIQVLIQISRWIYRIVDKRCLVTAVIYAMACYYLSGHLSTGVCPCFQRSDANPVHQPGFATF